MSRYEYGYLHNRCEGWFVATAQDLETGERSESARKTSFDEVREAIQHHHRTGLWPSEVVEARVAVCPTCGQPLPEGD